MSRSMMRAFVIPVMPDLELNCLQCTQMIPSSVIRLVILTLYISMRMNFWNSMGHWISGFHCQNSLFSKTFGCWWGTGKGMHFIPLDPSSYYLLVVGIKYFPHPLSSWLLIKVFFTYIIHGQLSKPGKKTEKKRNK